MAGFHDGIFLTDLPIGLPPDGNMAGTCGKPLGLLA